MALTWLLEADVLHFQSEPLRAEIRRQGMQAHVNGFSCAGLYECDLGAVVKAASECARA